MTVRKGIAVGAIWASVAVTSFSIGFGAVLVAFFAVCATDALGK